jgi:peptidoglycan/xylan/chitin deacetylase (PgdA/CDA1 family)
MRTHNQRIRHGSRASGAIALTFDDGPGSDTSGILDELRERGATATFFVVGSRIASRAELLARIVAEGHEIGSHSWSHERHQHPGPAFVRDLVRTSIAIRRAAGVFPRWFRPPYARWTPGIGRAARLAGMATVTWDVDPRDWEADDAATVVERVLLSTQPGSIVLLHEGGGGLGVEALPSLLDNLRAQDLKFVSVSALLANR